MKNLKQTAEFLIGQSISVVPVKDKAPMFREWQNIFQEQILDDKFQWAWKKANGLGVLTGKPSGLICLDIDILAGDERLKNVRAEIEKHLPPMFVGIKGNPEKIPARFFAYNGIENEKFKAIDCEILSTGNQKVIPPSWNHDSKTYYEWEGRPIEDIDIDDFPVLDEFIINLLRSLNEEYRTGTKGESRSKELTSEKGRSKHGSHNVLSAEAVKLFHKGFRFEDIVDLCLKLDIEINLGEDAFYFLCPSRPWRSKNKRLNAAFFVSEVFYRNLYKRYDGEFFKEELANGFTWRDPNAEKPRPIRQVLSLYNYLKIKSDLWYCPEIKSFQVWDGKKYDIKPEDWIKAFAQKHYKNPPCTKISDKHEFLDYCRNEQQTTVKEFTLRDTGLINFKNGIYDLRTKTIVKHDRSYKLPYLIPHPIKEMETPVFETLLELICKGKPSHIRAIKEFIGYCLSACCYNRFNKLLILDGAGANGKSTLIRIIQGLLGAENTSSVTLESITKERFAAFNLVNKLANFCSEEHKEAFSNTGPIKKLTGGDSIMVEEKHKGAFQYNNLAKLIISYNKMPFFPDDSSGMRRRIILIPCEQDFDANPELKIKDVETRIAQEEYPGIAYTCVKAFDDVCERGEFTRVTEGEARVQEMIDESNPVYSFIKDQIEVTNSKNDFVSNAALLDAFNQYQGALTKMTTNTLSRRVLEKLQNEGVVQRDSRKILDRSHRGIVGIALK